MPIKKGLFEGAALVFIKGLVDPVAVFNFPGLEVDEPVLVLTTVGLTLFAKNGFVDLF